VPNTRETWWSWQRALPLQRSWATTMSRCRDDGNRDMRNRFASAAGGERRSVKFSFQGVHRGAYLRSVPTRHHRPQRLFPSLGSYRLFQSRSACAITALFKMGKRPKNDAMTLEPVRLPQRKNARTDDGDRRYVVERRIESGASAKPVYHLFASESEFGK
jgi:hypothetical protein